MAKRTKSQTKKPAVQEVLSELDSAHRDLALLTISKLSGTPFALNTSEVVESHPLPLKRKTTESLKDSIARSAGEVERDRLERTLFACMDLTVLERTASLWDMMNFYMERGRMIIGPDKVPAPEVVPWLQAESDFDRREIMKKECGIFFRKIVNPMLLGILELTVKTVTERFGFRDFVEYSEAKKQISFDVAAGTYTAFLDRTQDLYLSRMIPWVEDVVGRPFENLSRYHALHLLRVRRFDEYFPVSRLMDLVRETFKPLGLDLDSRGDVITDVTADPAKNPDGICVGVEIPGEVHVLARPVGGLIDLETVLHEMGHAYFLSHFSPDLPLEHRRFYRSPALDETFAFLFMNLIGNSAWLSKLVGMPMSDADALARVFTTKRLCLIRRYIGKFLAEKELHESGNIKDPGPYCRNLERATGFVYEPEGYLIDMDQDFYSVDYLAGWAGADVLGGHLEARYGTDWFASPQAGDFLRDIAANGRRDSLDKVLEVYCGEKSRLPSFSSN